MALRKSKCTSLCTNHVKLIDVNLGQGWLQKIMYYPTQWLFLFYILAMWPSLLTCQDRPNRYSETSGKRFCADGERTRICVPADYIKFELPEDERPTYVKVGVDIKDIPKVNDKDFSITMNAYFIVKWQDRRLIVEKRNRTSKHFMPDSREILTSKTSEAFTSSDSRLVLHVLSGLCLSNVFVLIN